MSIETVRLSQQGKDHLVKLKRLTGGEAVEHSVSLGAGDFTV